MGWKASFMVIKTSDKSESDEKILTDFGFSNLVKKGEKSFSEVILPYDNCVYIGRYRDSLVVCDADAINQNFEAETSLSKLDNPF